MIEYCTLFDMSYLAQGLALYKSIDKHHAAYRLHILAACDESYAILKELNLPNVVLYSLAEVETDALRKLHPLLKHFEYVCALKPNFMLEVLQTADHVAYIDADSYFFSTGETLIRSFREDSSIPVAITPHRFTPTRRHFLKNGEFNAGFIYATHDGIPCLKEWNRRCVENRTGRMTDQQCINAWPKQWNAHIIKHKGLNLAPWNQEQYKYSLRNGQVYVDDDPLIWYHFHQGQTPAYHLDEFVSQHVYQIYKGDLQTDVEITLRELRAQAQAFREDAITIFTVPHGFTGEHAIRQINALNSWIRLRPRPEIILLGNDPGIKEAAEEFGCVHDPDIMCDKHGIPILSHAFKRAHKLATHEVVAFVNTDIILFQDLITAIGVSRRKFPIFLMVGRRCVLNVTVPIEFSAGWERRLRQEVDQCGYRDGPSAIDYLVFSPRELPKLDMPPFLVGSPGWDNWIVYQYDKREDPVVDASRDVMCVHHHHSVAWPAHGVRTNRTLADYQSNIITHSHWVLQDQTIVHRTKSAALPKLGLPKPDERPITFPLSGASRPVKLVSSPLPQSYVASAVVHARPAAIVVKPAAMVHVEHQQLGLKNYCTYVSSEQIVQYLAMYESMVKWCAPFKLWTMSLDEPALALLHKLKLKHAGLLPTFYKSNQNLRQLKRGRSNEEYTRTLKPLLLQHVMKLDIDGVIYLDTNSCFFDHPDSLYREIAAVNIAITPHRFGAGQNGKFNAGFMYFRKGEKKTFDCIVKWCDQVMTSCENSPGHFYEQKYLEVWPSRWGAHSIRHKGVNLAPWNQGSGQYKYEMRGSASRYHLYVDNDPLIWYNFSRSNDYGIDGLIRNVVYGPYEKAVEEARGRV